MWFWICSLFSGIRIFSQNGILLNREIEPEHDIIFSPAYIKNNKIEKVLIDILDKKDGELLRDYQKKKKVVYDNLGRCVSKLYTFPSVYGNIFTTAKVRDGKVLKREQALAFDSIMYYYYYNEKHQYTKTVQGNGLQFYNYMYTYDSANVLKTEKKIYEICKVFLDGQCEPEHQKLLYEAAYKTTYYGKMQSKTIVYNEEKRPYKEIIRNFDGVGNIVSEQESFLLSPFYTKYTWLYNDKGELISKSYFKEEVEQWKINFTYEVNGQLSSEKIYKLGIFVNELMYVYELGTPILNSCINRDIIGQKMQIIKLNYILNN